MQFLEPASSAPAGTAAFTLASTSCTKMKANLEEVSAASFYKQAGSAYVQAG